MRIFNKIKWILITSLCLFIAGFFFYALPGRDIVKITGTDVVRFNVGENSWLWASQDAGTAPHTTRDVRIINSQKKNGKPRVYRNEDTAWGWPPYLKFDSGNLQAEAQAYAREPEQWVAVTHYGWRITMWSMYPNAVKIVAVDGPNVKLIPWFNIIFLFFLLLIILFIIRFIMRFKMRHIDPVIDNISDTIDDSIDYVEDGAQNMQNSASRSVKGVRQWVGDWFGKT